MRCGRSFLLLLLFSIPAAAAEPPARVQPFTLPDTTGKPVSPLAAKDRKAWVVVFVGTECPINNAYMPRLVELQKEYGERAWLRRDQRQLPGHARSASPNMPGSTACRSRC